MSRPDDWAGYDDPFGDWHEDPCEEVPEPADVANTQDGEQR
jgi:hypothetical protein